MAAKDTEDQKPEEQDADLALDMSQAAVKKMIAEAREKGYITYDQLNKALPPDQVSSEQIEDVMSMLSEMGINIIEDDDAEEEDSKSTAVAEIGKKGDCRARVRQGARSSTAPTIRCACTCARWARSNC